MKVTTRTAIITILALAYIALLLKLIVFKYPVGYIASGEVNLIPFKTILTYLSGHPTWTVAWNNLAGNSALFVPLGALLAFIPTRTLKGITIAVISLGIGVAMEVTQALLQKGIFDIDDILLNALGVVVGYLLTVAIIKHINKTKQQT